MSVFTKNDFQFGYLYGWLDCYNKEYESDIEDFILQINKRCGKTILDLMMLRELMEIISFDTPEIIKNYITVGDSEQDFFVRIVDNKVELFEHDYIDCCKLRCHNKADMDLDNERPLCFDCNKELIDEERDEYNRLERTGNLIGENPYKNINACVVCSEEIPSHDTGIKCKTCKHSMCFQCCCEYNSSNDFECDGDETGTCVDIKIPCAICRTKNIFCV